MVGNKFKLDTSDQRPLEYDPFQIWLIGTSKANPIRRLDWNSAWICQLWKYTQDIVNRWVGLHTGKSVMAWWSRYLVHKVHIHTCAPNVIIYSISETIALLHIRFSAFFKLKKKFIKLKKFKSG